MDKVLASEAQGKSLGEHVVRKVMAYGGKMMLTQFEMQAGGGAPPHHHPHEQMSYVVSGRFEYTRGDETMLMGPGDSIYFGPDVLHGARCLEAGVALDIFTPIREDFLE